MKYNVTIESVIRKTIHVEAPDEDEAQHLAHQLFTVECDGDEFYSQDVVDWEESED